MNNSPDTSVRINAEKNQADSRQPQKGFIVFCERNLRYEKGFKAWIFLGPYLLGAIGLKMLIGSVRMKDTAALWPWVGFLTYLIFFPSVWRRILKLLGFRKADPVVSLR